MPTSKQRREAERRRLRRQAERRQQQQSRRRRLNVLLSVVGTLVLVGVVVGLLVATSGSDSTPKPAASTTASTRTPTPTASTTATTSTTPSPSTTPTPSATPTPTRTVATTTTCRYPASGTAARKVARPPTTASTTGTATLRLATSQGAMTFTLNRATAPCAVNSVVSLVRQKFYDATSCHRLVTKSIFLLQCGDPTGTGRGGPGYSAADEPATSPVYRRGSVVMANSGTTTFGSQFFVIDRDTTLGATYTQVGTVTSGLGVADKVYRAGTTDGSTDGPPELPLTFRTVRVA